MIRVSDHQVYGDVARALRQSSLTPSISTMEGSRILAAATEAKELKAKGVDVCDLTVGDFAPEQFRAPESFLRDVAAEVVAGRNQYPPSDGIPDLQKAVTAFYERELGVQFPDRSVVICGGARPPIYAVFRCLVGVGDKVVYFVPSWNNDYYVHLSGGQHLPVKTTPENNFFPTVEDITTRITDPAVRLVCLCSPLNPCGTVIDPEVLKGICQAITQENRRRQVAGQKPVHLLWDQVYWPLVYGETEFHHPIELVPEISPWVIYIDAISKWMVGTGLRLGWAVVPTYLYEPMRDFMGHVGGWGPRPVQVATAVLLGDGDVLHSYWEGLRGALQDRLVAVYTSFKDMEAAGLPVTALVPQGAIYTSVRFDVIGKTTPGGQVLKTNDDVRRYLLNEAQVALVAFQAFSLWEDTGWFRISVGAVGTEALSSGLGRLRGALEALR